MPQLDSWAPTPRPWKIRPINRYVSVLLRLRNTHKFHWCLSHNQSSWWITTGLLGQNGSRRSLVGGTQRSGNQLWAFGSLLFPIPWPNYQGPTGTNEGCHQTITFLLSYIVVHEIFLSHQLSYFLTTSQGNDVGTQYSSVIFCEDEKQTKIANSVKEEVQRLVDAGKIKYAGKTVHTAIVGANRFYAAHEEHQAYLEKNPLGYCNHFYRFKDWPVLNWGFGSSILKKKEKASTPNRNWLLPLDFAVE